MLRYAFVGGIATLVQYLVLVTLVELAGVSAAWATMFGAACGALVSASFIWIGTRLFQVHYLVPQAAATVLVVIAGFSMNRRWTFA